jgi:hypothetical protein
MVELVNGRQSGAWRLKMFLKLIWAQTGHQWGCFEKAHAEI